MVRLALFGVLACAACAVDGVVLVVESDAGMDAALDAGLDAAIEPSRDAELDAAGDAQLDATLDAQATAVGVCRISGATDGFYESFPDGPLDARWLVADGAQSFATFKRQNVAVVNGNLELTATPDGAAAIATRDLFDSATYQVQGRVSAGVQLSLWWRRDDDSDGSIEIGSPGQGGDYTRVAMRTRDATAVSEDQFALASTLDDGSDHILRFDRYTTNNPSVNFWVDDVARWSTGAHLPSSRAGRMWIVATGSGVVRITNTFITPFGNGGDACRDGELRGPGLVAP